MHKPHALATDCIYQGEGACLLVCRDVPVADSFPILALAQEKG